MNAAGFPTASNKLEPALSRQSEPLRPATFFLSMKAVVMGGIVLAAVAAGWRAALPSRVNLVRPEVREITETIAASGIVAGNREVIVGSRVIGIVSKLLVREGDSVRTGQLIARISSEVAESQLSEAEQALRAAHAQLRQAAMRPRSSEVDSARARVRHAEASLGEILPQIERAELVIKQAEDSVAQAVEQVERARAAARQAEARRELAARTAARYRVLHDEGAISAQALDQVMAELASAEADKSSSDHAVKAAYLAAETARTSVLAAAKDAESMRTRAVAANAALKAARSDLETLDAGPRFESVETAREQARQTARGVETARAQARLSEVRAPFSGRVTEIIAEVGASAAAGGIVKLVETGAPEIRLNVDESNLADLKPGQQAVITSSAYRGVDAAGSVVRIGSRVDSARGTVEVVVTPHKNLAWIRPGQTVNVNVVLSERSRKVVIPTSAVRLEASRTVVLKIVNGRASPVQVETGHARDNKLPVLGGITERDVIILNAEKVKTGARVTGAK